nr:FlgO family outer membrane protein [Bowmanella denitrificans]
MMKTLIPVVALSLFLSGCTTLADNEQEQALSKAHQASLGFGQQYRPQFQQQPGQNTEKRDPQLHNINHYVRGIMQDLVNNLQFVSARTPVAVSSFVFLDGPFDQADLLGNQIAESFMHEIHQFGIPLIDIKTSDFIRVTEQGDFVLSRDYLEVSPKQPVQYVITGTLARHQGGYLINARVVGMKSKMVVGSAQGFLPADVANALLNSAKPAEGVKLLKG